MLVRQRQHSCALRKGDKRIRKLQILYSRNSINLQMIYTVQTLLFLFFFPFFFDAAASSSFRFLSSSAAMAANSSSFAFLLAQLLQFFRRFFFCLCSSIHSSSSFFFLSSSSIRFRSLFAGTVRAVPTYFFPRQQIVVPLQTIRNFLQFFCTQAVGTTSKYTSLLFVDNAFAMASPPFCPSPVL